MDIAHLDFIIDGWKISGTDSLPIQQVESESITPFWLHCDRSSSAFGPWLLEQGFDRSIVESVIANDTRPRFQQFNDNCFFLIVRGVNLNKGKQPDDMLTVRMLYTPERLITCNAQTARAVESVRENLRNGRGPLTLELLVIEILSQLNLRIEQFLEPIESFIDAQDREQFDKQQIQEINDMHNRLLKLNRFLKPQIHALQAINKAELPQFSQQQVALANQLDVLSRIVETIDFYISQIDVINAKISQINSELMNRNTYILSIIAGIFLPLGFLTGLFGINIGGMPGVENGDAFYWFCGILTVIGVLEFVIFRRLKFL
ncbi:CorA family divalent cation transporter [Colwellia sp. MEBiC06753]